MSRHMSVEPFAQSLWLYRPAHCSEGACWEAAAQ